MELREKQQELDVIKWEKSYHLHMDACGSFNYCSFCDKSKEYPCARACNLMEGIPNPTDEVIVTEIPVNESNNNTEEPIKETKKTPKKTTSKKSATTKTTATKTTKKSTSKKTTKTK